jgi:hypothetical protein
MKAVKLMKLPGGAYRGQYLGQELIVRREEVRRRSVITGQDLGVEIKWVAQAGQLEASSVTRGKALRSLCLQLDMDAVEVPEIDALLRRLAVRVQALELGRLGPGAMDELIHVQQLLRWIEEDLRLSVVRLERSLARLEALATGGPERLVDQRAEGCESGS